MKGNRSPQESLKKFSREGTDRLPPNCFVWKYLLLEFPQKRCCCLLHPCATASPTRKWLFMMACWCACAWVRVWREERERASEQDETSTDLLPASGTPLCPIMVCVYTHACVCECGGGGMTNQQCPSTSEKHFQISLHSIRKLLFGRNLDSRGALYPLNTKTSLERIKMDNVSRSTSLNWAVSGWAETKLAFSRVRSAIQCLWSLFPSENSREEKHPRVTVFRMLTLRNEYLWLINTCKSSSFCSFENQAPRSTN